MPAASGVVHPEFLLCLLLGRTHPVIASTFVAVYCFPLAHKSTVALSVHLNELVATKVLEGILANNVNEKRRRSVQPLT